jgi:long-chain acyl-CoA synthetase
MTGDWLHNGDLGFVSNDGYVNITGRKKDLIITSSGKNITSQNIENSLQEIRWISDAVVNGGRRPYLVCLVTLDRDESRLLSEQLGIADDPASMARGERVHAVVEREDQGQQPALRPDRADQALRDSRPRPDPGRRQADPTLKVKRNVVYKRYASIVERLYDAGGASC